LLQQIKGTFAEPAREKNLSLRVLPSDAWVRSDFILLERILFNLVSNALRYTSQGGVVVACRKRGEQLRIEVWDTGLGIADDQRQNIFSEFYRVGEPERDQRAGLGLGLAIVERLCTLLALPIELKSVLSRGSRFTVGVPQAPVRAATGEPVVTARAHTDLSHGKLVVVIDDDLRVLDGMSGLLRSWGCRVVPGDTAAAVTNGVGADPPDLIISDYRLSDGRTGIEAIGQLRHKFGCAIPAFLISGDTHSDTLHHARANGLHLLHKPVDPMALRAVVNRMLRKQPFMDVTS
jgi:CheY-like chemotaxis protein